MIFNDKFNNSLYIMCRVDNEFGEAIIDYIMDIPTNVINKIQDESHFVYDEDDVYVEYESNNNYVDLYTDFDSNVSSLRVFSFEIEDLKNMETCYEGETLLVGKKGKQLGCFEFEDEMCESVFNYAVILLKFEKEYELILLESKAKIDDNIEEKDIQMEVCCVQKIKHEELMEIMNMENKNAVRR